jgi:hypothetical protein
MAIVRRSRADIEKAKLLADLAAQPQPDEATITAQAAADGDAWSDDDVARAEAAHPPPSAEQIRALRARLGLS